MFPKVIMFNLFTMKALLAYMVNMKGSPEELLIISCLSCLVYLTWIFFWFTLAIPLLCFCLLKRVLQQSKSDTISLLEGTVYSMVI